MKVTVMKAVYGTPDKGIDVTKNCQSIVDKQAVADTISITPGNKDGMPFPDPASGVIKSFAIQFTMNDDPKVYEMACKEGETLVIQSTIPTIQKNGVTVLWATYGTPNGKSFDVTKACQALVDQGKYIISANIATFGDPSERAIKTFAITYIKDGVVFSRACGENGTISL